MLKENGFSDKIYASFQLNIKRKRKIYGKIRWSCNIACDDDDDDVNL